MESGWNVLVWLVGVVSRRRKWVKSMGVATGCGCKEVYRLLILLILLLLYLFFFAAASLLFVHFCMFFVLISVLFL